MPLRCPEGHSKWATDVQGHDWGKDEIRDGACDPVVVDEITEGE